MKKMVTFEACLVFSWQLASLYDSKNSCGVVFVPEFAPHLHPQFQMLAPAPGPSSPSGVFSSRAVMQSFTRLIIVLGICIVFMGLVLFLLIMLVIIVHRKRKAFQSPEDQKPLTGKRLPTIRSKDGTCAISKGRNCRKGETKCIYWSSLSIPRRQRMYRVKILT